MSPIHYFNFQLKKDTEYFLYVGELKNYGLNFFLQEALEKIHDRKIGFIAVVPDVFEQYNYENVIVINPLVDHETGTCRENYHCRVSAKDFMSAVSNNPDIRSLIDKILQRQKQLYLYMYESHCEMTLDEIPGVRILGPDKTTARKMNDKSVQLTGLQGAVPLVDFKICESYDDLIQKTNELWDSWDNGIFVTKTYSAAGINSIVAFEKKEVEQKFFGQDGTYLITRYMPHTYDPTVLGVVAAERQVYVAGVADQRIADGNRFTGSTFPSVLDEATQEKLENYTKRVGAWLARNGYRGIFGCDYIVTEKGEIYFLEVNARKQGTTLEFCCTLDQILPEWAPNLPELEYHAVTHDSFPKDVMHPPGELKGNIHWGTFNYKVSQSVRTTNYIPQNAGERKAFKKIAKGRLKKDFLILEHAGSDFKIAAGAFLARIVALGHDHESVAQGIEQGCRTIELTFNPKN